MACISSSDKYNWPERLSVAECLADPRDQDDGEAPEHQSCEGHHQIQNNGEIERAGPRDYVGVIAFGREPSVELAPTRKESLADWRIKEIASNPPRDYTDIAAALRLAEALVPKDSVGRFMLISDGNENLESATEEAARLSASRRRLCRSARAPR